MNDLELWEAYKYEGDQQARKELIKRYLPKVRAQARIKFGTTGTVPMGAVEAEGLKQVSSAIDNYDPTKGAHIGTHIFNYLQKMSRFYNTHAFPVRPSEEIFGVFSNLRDTEQRLQDRLGRSPNLTEIADAMKMSESNIVRIKNQIKDVSGLPDFGLKEEHTEVDDYMDYIRVELSPQEKYVFDHTVGWKGAKKMKAGTIAENLKVSPAQVSHIKNKVSKKFEDNFDIGGARGK